MGIAMTTKFLDEMGGSGLIGQACAWARFAVALPGLRRCFGSDLDAPFALFLEPTGRAFSLLLAWPFLAPPPAVPLLGRDSRFFVGALTCAAGLSFGLLVDRVAGSVG